MLTDIIVIDDVFDDPDFIVHKARGMTYYNRFDHPDIKKDGAYTNYSGVRTESLHVLDLYMYKTYNKILIDKIIKNSFGQDSFIVKYNYTNRLFFHYLADDNIFNKNWLHSDTCLCAGVVYLNKNPPRNSGTIIIKDGEEYIVENKYNRLVLYNGEIKHSPQNSFGKTVYDGRLTLTIFFDELGFNMARKYVD